MTLAVLISSFHRLRIRAKKKRTHSGAELEELLNDVVAENVGHQSERLLNDLVEDALLLAVRGSLELLLNEPAQQLPT